MSEAVLFTFSIFWMIFMYKYLFEFIDRNRKKHYKKIIVILINIGFIISGLMTNLLMILFSNDYRYADEVFMPLLEIIKILNTLMSKMLVPNFIMIILIVIFIIVTDKKEE